MRAMDPDSSPAALPRPVYFDDFAPGQVYDLGTYEISEEEVLEFGRRYDPQPFHADPAAAKASAFGGLIASGWHTCSVFMRLYVDAILAGAEGRGSPGVDAVRWWAPVRPGDVVRGWLRITDTRPSSKHADRGTVILDASLTNQDGVKVMSFVGWGLFARRP
jgi:acyl dehydratase